MKTNYIITEYINKAMRISHYLKTKIQIKHSKQNYKHKKRKRKRFEIE